MSHRNDLVAAGAVVIVAGVTPVNYVGLGVITASDITFQDGKGQSVALTAVPAGMTLPVVVRQVTVCSGVVLGYQPA